jgi:IclR family pca regulon transcriptional regulator
VARDGFAMVDQELEEGLRSIAVPIRDAAGSVAALNVSVHASRTDLRTLRKRFVPQVLAAAAAIENDIRGAGGSVG